MQLILTRSGRLALIASVLGLYSSTSSATTANAVWTGGSSGSDFWSDTANWLGTGGNPDGAGTSIIHFAGTTRLGPVNNYGAFTTFNQVLFDAGAGSFTLTGAAIKLTANGGSVAKIENNSANPQTVSFDSGGTSLVFIGSGELDPTLGDLTINNNIFVDGSGTQVIQVFGNNGHTLTLNGALKNGSATAALTNENNNIIVLNGVNTYTGETTIKGGELRFGANGSANSSTIRLGNTSGSANATISLADSDGGSVIASLLNPRGGSSGTRTLQSLNTTGTNTWSGNVFLDGNLTVTAASGGTLALTGTTIDLKNQTMLVSGSGSVAISGALQNSTGSGKLTKSGSGTLTLSGANSYVGATTISDGTLLLGANERIGNASALVLDGGRFATGGFSDTVGALTLSSSSILDLGAGTGSFMTFSGLTPGFTGILTIQNWSGTASTVGNADRILFPGPVNTSFLEHVLFQGFNGDQPGALFLDAGGGTFELVAVPEPATAFGAIGLMAVAAFRERRRLQAVVRRFASH